MCDLTDTADIQIPKLNELFPPKACQALETYIYGYWDIRYSDMFDVCTDILVMLILHILVCLIFGNDSDGTWMVLGWYGIPMVLDNLALCRALIYNAAQF